MAAPVHPMPQMQGAFEESMRETLADSDPAANPYLDADKFQRRKLLLERPHYERTVAGRWLQKPGESFHPLWKLVAQISFGMHLLHMGLARSDADVIQILQTHVDEIDGFLERTTEDFELAEQDVHERIKHLRTPLEHGDVFDTMLGDREFRTAIVDGNEKIEHILSRTTVYMKDSVKDIQKGLDGTRQLARFLKDIDRKWPNKSHEHAAVYSAMLGNTEGWAEAYKHLKEKGSDLGLSLVQLEGIVSEIQRRAGVASRRNLPARQSIPPAPRSARDSQSVNVSNPPPRVDLPVQSPFQVTENALSPKKYLPEEPSTRMAISRDGKASHVIELPADGRPDRQSMQASLIHSSSSTKTQSSAPGQLTELQPVEAHGNEHRAPLSNEDQGPDGAHISQLEREITDTERDSKNHTEVVENQPLDLQAANKTYFGYVSDDAASQDAQHVQSSGQSRHGLHLERASSLVSSDLNDPADEDGIINHAHPLLQDLRSKEVLVVDTTIHPAAQSPIEQQATDSLSPDKRRNSFRDSGDSRQARALSASSHHFHSNRDSTNTMATPVSLGDQQQRSLSKRTIPVSHSLDQRNPLQKVAPIITESASPRESPPSPSLQELTSATVAGPDIGDPFAPISPVDKPRHPELLDRINYSLKSATDHGSLPDSNNVIHSRSTGIVMETTSEAPTVTTTTTIIPKPTSASTTSYSVAQRASHGGEMHLQVQPYAGQRTGPSSPPIATQYRNLSPFPSTSSRGSRRPSIPAQDLMTLAEGSQTKKSGFKKLFTVRRNGRNHSVGNF